MWRHLFSKLGLNKVTQQVTQQVTDPWWPALSGTIGVSWFHSILLRSGTKVRRRVDPDLRYPVQIIHPIGFLESFKDGINVFGSWIRSIFKDGGQRIAGLVVNGNDGVDDVIVGKFFFVDLGTNSTKTYNYTVQIEIESQNYFFVKLY